jgi:uncharacterized protein
MNTPLSTLIQARLSRRSLLGAFSILGLPSLGVSSLDNIALAADLMALPHPDPLPQTPDEHLRIPEGYKATRVISWGDRLSDGETLPLPISSSAHALSAFGYNNDYIAFHPLSDEEGRPRGLLSINHEYVCPSLMFPGVSKDRCPEMSLERSRIEMGSVGHSVIEVYRSAPSGQPGEWRVRWGSRYHRRLSALGPKMEIRGPVQGHPRVRTSADPKGRWVIGTCSNCAGGQTPWGTTLIAEENVNHHFFGDHTKAGHEAEALKRYDYVERSRRTSWHRVDPRFDFNQEPHEPNRFGWIVELDPAHPDRPPVKRTALGRFKHECATCTLTADGRVAVYSGDDQADEHLYRFLSRDAYRVDQPQTHWGLLDHGVLQVARFEVDGGLTWLDLSFGEGPLTPKNGFKDQGDVLIEARRAAMLLGASRLDRPEDVEIHPHTGKVYVMLTQNRDRAEIEPGSPRAPNESGHLIEISPLNGDHGARTARWDPFLLGGPSELGGTQVGAGWIKNPDNGAFDPRGGLWVSADAHSSTVPSFGNGLWKCTLTGDRRGQAERFCTTPVGSEPCGPCFTPDGRSLFVSIQHPGEGTHWAAPSTRWPDFRSDRPPRPSVVVIERLDGAII